MREAWLATEILELGGLGVGNPGQLGFLLCLRLGLYNADMKAISASLTACCVGSLVASSNVSPLMTVRITTPRRMNSRIVSLTSS
jgi:hypothetical protein